MKLGEENGFDVDTTQNARFFNEDTLKRYSAVVFLNTSGNVLDYHQEPAMERYIQSGGGFVGIHCASCTEYGWHWYGRLVGAYFTQHPEPQQATVKIVDPNDPATKGLPGEWTRTDEWYNFRDLQPDIHVLAEVDESTYHGGKMGAHHPVSWYHEYDGGRAWYTSMGHFDSAYTDPRFLHHLLGGIEYAIGKNLELNYSDATSQYPPSEDRFTKTALVHDTFTEPTEMTILPNLDILVAQRRGDLSLYKQATKSVKLVGKLNVYWHTDTPGVNAEEGMLGLKADPHYADNHFIYIYYSPADTSVNRLSRFTFKNDTLDLSTEKIILQLYSQRNICCHTGGSIDFGPDGQTLFLSTGDNSTPFDEPGQRYASHGYAPLDDRPGHEQYDARRSAGNTNDLRGKILRIKINSDGTYDIPKGNLFPPGTPKTRPEIYVMGDRNPYRIQVDKKNGNLYWGEVGPDAPNDSLDTRGPMGYDEVNQARSAGYFGWPLFVGNNYPYHEYDYATGKSGPPFDPQHPVNDSKNNTGLRDLPPANPAFIWYPYGVSREFPQVGTGGRNAMAGPVYYTDMFPRETRLPDYYNGKLFIYDWVRNWIRVVTMLPNGDYDKMEPFMPHIHLANLIDMEVGPDGKLYLLEYGTGWFLKNPDAGLSRIDYNGGNLPPKISAFNSDKVYGTVPMEVTLSVKASDFERTPMSYTWNLGNGETKQTKEPELDYTFQSPGDYNTLVTVADAENATSASEVMVIHAGNTPPVVHVNVKGNQSFFFPGQHIAYSVDVKDAEDGTINPTRLYVQSGFTGARSGTLGDQVVSDAVIGENMIQSLDCKSCHLVDKHSVGPSFTQVAQKYGSDPASDAYLADKIISGGSGVWGETAMAAHPGLSHSDALELVAYIKSLTGEKKKSLGNQGVIVVPTSENDLAGKSFYLYASYTDQGGKNNRALAGADTLVLRYNNVSLAFMRNREGMTPSRDGVLRMLKVSPKGGWVTVPDVDLSDVHTVTLAIVWLKPVSGDYSIQLHIRGADGPVVGETTFRGPDSGGRANIPIKLQVADQQPKDLYIVVTPKGDASNDDLNLASATFRNH